MTSKTNVLRRTGLVAAIAALILVPAAASQDGPPYADGTGDSGGAPDISGISVIGDASSGQVTFRILETNPAMVGAVTELDIDSDSNPATGDSRSAGADYAFQSRPSEHLYGFWHWNGVDWVETPYSTVRVSDGSTGITISVNKSELGNAATFNFGAATFMIDKDGGDSAPDLGLYNYSLDAGGPDIKSVLVQTTPSAGPKAGKPFVLTPVGLKLPPDGAIVTVLARPDSYSCTSKLGARALVGKGVGGCTLGIAKKKTRGKKLSVVLTVTYQGATKRFPFTFVVS